MKKIGILHLSDIHASSDTKDSLIHLTECLLSDIQRIQEQYETEIKLICITGDLINSGAKVEEEIGIASEVLIEPLLRQLALDNDAVFVVPGNHEVDKTKIISYMERGIASELVTCDNIEECMRVDGSTMRMRISHFDMATKKYGGEPVYSDEFCRAYLHNINGFLIGIAGWDSAWRSTGIGGAERGKMILGKDQIIKTEAALRGAQLKIGMLHHPTDWLMECDKTSVEKYMPLFDIILNGHIHETLSSVHTSFNGHTLFNTCGKFDNTSDIYNGYSVLSINPYTNDCDVILRQYYEGHRNSFDKAISLCQDGVFKAVLGCHDSDSAIAYNVVTAIRHHFTKYICNLLISNVAAGNEEYPFEKLFIMPKLDTHSEYEKETLGNQLRDRKKKKGKVSLEEILNCDDNLVVIGKTESGKTTLLHYLAKKLLDNYDDKHRVPIIIDCANAIFQGKNVVIKNATNFVNAYCSEDKSFSQNDIEKLLLAGKCTVMFDGFDLLKQKHQEKVNDFLKQYPKNRFVFMETESLQSDSFTSIPAKPGCEYSEYHICQLARSQIRQYAETMIISEEKDQSSVIVDHVLSCFMNTSLPRTPFILTMIMSVSDKVYNSSINEAVVLEQFMELLLNKKDANEASTVTFDFRAKENFLIALVSKMHELKTQILTLDEFEDFVHAYHKYVGFNVSETRFNEVFFLNGVLLRHNHTVMFRYGCIYDYYLAKKMANNNQFLEYLMEDHRYLDYTSAMMYYTELNRHSSSVISKVQSDLQIIIGELLPTVTERKDYTIGVNLAVQPDMLTERIQNHRFSQEESDELSDFVSNNLSKKALLDDESGIQTLSEEELPHEEKNFNMLLSILRVFGLCLKNLEFISREEKEKAYEVYLETAVLIITLFNISLESTLDKTIDDITQKSGDNEEDIKEIKEIFADFMKISLPICIQNFTAENVGTTKLKQIIQNTIAKYDVNSFEHFFTIFMLCDLHMSESRAFLKTYVKKITDKAMMQIVFMKLLYYYKMRYFDSKFDSDIENMLADLNIKMGSVKNNQRGIPKGVTHGLAKKQLMPAMIQEFKKERIPIAEVE